MGTRLKARAMRGAARRLASKVFTVGKSARIMGTGIATKHPTMKSIMTPVCRRQFARCSLISPLFFSWTAREIAGNTAVAMETVMRE